MFGIKGSLLMLATFEILEKFNVLGVFFGSTFLAKSLFSCSISVTKSITQVVVFKSEYI